MLIFGEFFKTQYDKNIQQKRTKLHHIFKIFSGSIIMPPRPLSIYTWKYTIIISIGKFSWGSMPPNPPSNEHGFAMRGMSLCNIHISKTEKIVLASPPPKYWPRPWFYEAKSLY